MKPLYVMLIGLPASGKSTLCREILKMYPDKNWYVVSTDAFIEAEAVARGATYDAIFAETIDAATKEMNAERQAALSSGRNILHDQTNLTKKSRTRKLVSVPKTYCKIAILVYADPEERVNRLASRPDKSISAEIDQKMADSFEWPSHKEFDEIICGTNPLGALRYS